MEIGGYSGIDEAALAWHNVKSDGTGFWALTADELWAGEAEIATSYPAIMATGTSLIYGPLSLMRFFQIDTKCTLFDKLPDFVMVIDGVKYSVPPEHYILKQNGACASLMIPTNVQYILAGDLFLQRYYSVFDRSIEGAPRVGLANATGTYPAARAHA
jgi:hypothetical protein